MAEAGPLLRGEVVAVERPKMGLILVKEDTLGAVAADAEWRQSLSSGPVLEFLLLESGVLGGVHFVAREGSTCRRPASAARPSFRSALACHVGQTAGWRRAS